MLLQCVNVTILYQMGISWRHYSVGRWRCGRRRRRRRRRCRSSPFAVRQFEVRSSKFEVRSSKFEIKLAAFDRIVRCCIVPHGFALFRIVSHCSASFFGTVVVVLAVGCVFGSIEGKGSGAGGGHQGCVV